MDKTRRNAGIVWICLILFFIAFAYCLPKISDDWGAIYRPAPGGYFTFLKNSISKTWNSVNGDGRVIGNLINHISPNSSIVRITYWVLAMSALMFFMSRLTQATVKRWWWVCLPVLLVFLSPKAWFAGDITWTCGFTIYISPFVIMLVCLYQMCNIFYDKPVEDTWAKGFSALFST